MGSDVSIETIKLDIGLAENVWMLEMHQIQRAETKLRVHND